MLFSDVLLVVSYLIELVVQTAVVLGDHLGEIVGQLVPETRTVRVKCMEMGFWGAQEGLECIAFINNCEVMRYSRNN